MMSLLRPRWLDEVVRLGRQKSLLLLHGAVHDRVHYPIDDAASRWTLGSACDAAFLALDSAFGPYQILAAYDVVDGVRFADEQDAAQLFARSSGSAGEPPEPMGKLFQSVVSAAEGKPPDFGRARGTVPADAVDVALHQVRTCLCNSTHPTLFFLDHAGRLSSGPTHLSLGERASFVRLIKASTEAAHVRVTSPDGKTRVAPNLLLVAASQLTELPPWLYVDNPNTATIAVESPSTAERRHFFSLYVPVSPSATDPSAGGELDELADLTDGMSTDDLRGISTLARSLDSPALRPRELVDYFKYGVLKSAWNEVPLERLRDAEAVLGADVLGQPAAVAAVADVLRRARLNLSGAQHSSRRKPRGILFFAGPTGVGKTELAKAVARLVFSSEDALVRFDMSEFGHEHSDQRLLGAPPGYVGYEAGGELTNRVRANPFRVLLFDEIEKAHRSILDKFLQILEDGRLTDGHGDTVYFSESIVIFTSNVGIYAIDYSTGRPQIDPGTGRPVLNVDPAVHRDYRSIRGQVVQGVQEYFKYYLGRPELFNRIGQNIVVFNFVWPPVMRSILERKVLPSIARQVRELHKVEVTFATELVDQLMALIEEQAELGGRIVGHLAEVAIINPLARVLFDELTQRHGNQQGSCAHPLAGTHMRVLGTTRAETGDDHYVIAHDLEPAH